MAADPLTRATFEIINDPEASGSISITGLPEGASLELAPGQALVSPAGATPAPRTQEIIKLLPLKPPIKTALAGEPATLTAEELENAQPDEPLIVETIGRRLDLRNLTPVARQAVENERSLVVLARARKQATGSARRATRRRAT